MNRPQALVVFKKSIYQLYFRDRRSKAASNSAFSQREIDSLRASHERHQQAIDEVRRILMDHGVRYREVYRARNVNPDGYNFVVAVGGDGTFLEASKRVTDQLIVGVNSDPERSVGHFCQCAKDGFEAVLQRMIAGKAKVRRLQRLHLLLNGETLRFHVLNDILVAHRHPGAMSWYMIQVGATRERQRGSGIWISTAAGSSGAILAAGGILMKQESKKLQYLPRELFAHGKSAYVLRGGLIASTVPIVIHSLMRDGMIYVDGAHLRVPFHYGSKLEIQPSPHPLPMVVG